MLLELTFCRCISVLSENAPVAVRYTLSLVVLSLFITPHGCRFPFSPNHFPPQQALLTGKYDTDHYLY
jgi:hypothetical protein